MPSLLLSILFQCWKLSTNVLWCFVMTSSYRGYQFWLRKPIKQGWVIKGSQQVRRKVSTVLDANFYDGMTKYHVTPSHDCLTLTRRLLLVLIHAIFLIFIWNLVTSQPTSCIPISQYLKVSILSVIQLWVWEGGDRNGHASSISYMTFADTYFEIFYGLSMFREKCCLTGSASV